MQLRWRKLRDVDETQVSPTALYKVVPVIGDTGKALEPILAVLEYREGKDPQGQFWTEVELHDPDLH